MAVKLTRLTHKIAIQLQLLAESCTTCSSRSRRPVRKLLDTSSYNGKRRLWRSWRCRRPLRKDMKSQTNLAYLTLRSVIQLFILNAKKQQQTADGR
jgi:hypothetical protein